MNKNLILKIKSDFAYQKAHLNENENEEISPVRTKPDLKNKKSKISPFSNLNKTKNSNKNKIKKQEMKA